MLLLSLAIVILCSYVILESISVASSSKGLIYFLNQLKVKSGFSENGNLFLNYFYMFTTFVKECYPFCVVVRYMFNIIASLFIMYQPIIYLKCELISFILNTSTQKPFVEYTLLIYALALTLNCWGRMVYRLLGNRRYHNA